MNRGKLTQLVGVISVLLLVLALVASPAVAQPERTSVIVTFEDFADVGFSKQWIEKHGGQIEAVYHVVPGLTASLPSAAIGGLQHNPGVKNVAPNLQVYPVGEVYDWGVDRIDADVVHTEMQNTGAGVNIAIMDTGIDYNHSDLGAGFGSQFKVRGGDDFADRDGDPMDDVPEEYYGGHGTHCAGIATAESDGSGIIGAAPDSRLYALKIFRSSDGYGDYGYVISALEWAIDTWQDGISGNEVHVISMSFGSSYRDGNPGIESWIDAAYNTGIVLVGAAGNDGNPGGGGDQVIYPARYGHVISVGATDRSDRRASWSSAGPDLELMAPGVDIYSTYPYSESGYKTWGGTSMACPHVSGTAALVIASGIADSSGDGQINDEVRQRLISTADDLGDSGFDTKYGYGLVDADEAAAPITPVTDIAITAVNAPATVVQGEPVDIIVTIENVGNQDVGSAIDVTLNDDTDDGTLIGTQTISEGLAASDSIILTYSWDTNGASMGDHTLTASHNFTDDNASNDSDSTVITVVETTEVTVSAIDPDTMSAGGTTNVTITGSGFADGADVTFENGAGPAPTASNIVVVDANTITATVTAKSGGPPRNRVWDVRVTNPDASFGVLVDGFTVTA